MNILDIWKLFKIPNLIKNLYWPTEAEAPTLYYYDEYGYIRSSPGHNPGVDAQQSIDSYNIQRALMSQVEKNALDDFMKDVFPNFPIPSDPRDEIISTTLGSAPDPIVETFKLVRRTDPLVLDLDGDGFESTALSQGVLFDANGDGIRTGTAWFKADEGIVALDRNGNGVIDSGLELFGDETLLADGRPAPHGFAALAELDTGHVDPNAPVPGTRVGAGDGVIDAQDEGFANLRVWRDLNQDGVSQSAELQTLAESGVASIRAASQSVGIDYGDARLVQDGLFTRADGSQGQAGSFVLAQNFFTRAFTPIAQSADAQALQQRGGRRRTVPGGCMRKWANKVARRWMLGALDSIAAGGRF